MTDTIAWVPKVLSEYEVARAIAAIDAIALTGKPVAEVGCRRAIASDLESDLRECLVLAGEQGNVRVWTKPVGQRIRYGFYRESWVLDALDFLDRTNLSETDRAWISGLLFGYRPDAIQQFITRVTSSTGGESAAHATTRSAEAVAEKSM